MTFLLTQNFYCNFRFFAKTIVYDYFHNSDLPMSDINSRHPWRAVLVSKKTALLQNSIYSIVVHTFKPNFVHSFQINYKILDSS